MDPSGFRAKEKKRKRESRGKSEASAGPPALLEGGALSTEMERAIVEEMERFSSCEWTREQVEHSLRRVAREAGRNVVSQAGLESESSVDPVR